MVRADGQNASSRGATESTLKNPDGEWAGAARARDVEKTVSYYAENAIVMPPNSAAPTTKAAIRKGWKDMIETRLRLSPCRRPKWKWLIGATPPISWPLTGTAICMFQTSSSVVEKFAADGTDLGIFASSGCNHPLGIMFDRNGSLYVANQGNATIERYSRNGTDMGAFATTRGGPHFLVLLKVDAR